MSLPDVKIQEEMYYYRVTVCKSADGTGLGDALTLLLALTWTHAKQGCPLTAGGSADVEK